MLKHERVGRGRRWSGAAALAVLCVGTGVAAWASQPAQVRVTIRPAPNVGGLPSSTDSTAPPVVARDGADKALNRVAAAAKRAPAPSPPAPQSPPVEAPFVLAQATPAPAAGADAVRNFTLSPPPGADAPTGQWKAGWIGKTPNAPAPDPEQQAAARVFAEKALESVAGRALPDHGPIAITADHIVVDKNAGVTRYEGNATMVGDARELYGVQLLADGKPVNPRPGVPPIGPDTAGRFTLFAADSLELKFALNGDGSVGRLQRVDTHGGVLFGVGPARAAR